MTAASLSLEDKQLRDRRLDRVKQVHTNTGIRLYSAVWPALPWTKQSKGGRKEPKAPAPSRKGLLPPTVDQAVPKAG